MKEKSRNFKTYPAVRKLKQLAENPIDLTDPHQLTPERLATYYGEGCGFRLLYGTERVTEEVMDALKALATEGKAVEKMKKMQDGAVMNFIEHYPSENRPCLHT